MHKINLFCQNVHALFEHFMNIQFIKARVIKQLLVKRVAETAFKHLDKSKKQVVKQVNIRY